jgi:hypothetical protein
MGGFFGSEILVFKCKIHTILTNFDSPDAYFDNLCLIMISDPQAEKFGNKKCCNCKDSGGKPNRMPAKDIME